MTTAAASCAPCVFGAVSTSLLSFPYDIATLSVSIGTTISFVGNNTVPTIITVTSTLSPVTTVTTPPGAPPVTTITYTSGQPITWTTLDTTLTYPTTYVDYIAFEGAAATSTGCASTIAPTPLTIPAGLPTASLLYPFDYTGALPAGLLNYLDGQAAFIRQLNGDRLETCGGISGLAPVSASISSVTLTRVASTATIQTVSTAIPPPTTYTTTKTSATTSTTVIPATQPNTATQVMSVITFSGPIVVQSASFSTTLAPQSAILPSSSSTSGSSTSSHGSSSTSKPVSSSAQITSSIDLSSVLSVLSSKSSAARASSLGIYTNSTSPETSTVGTTIAPSKTTSLYPYTGAATPTAALSGKFWMNIAGSLGFALLL